MQILMPPDAAYFGSPAICQIRYGERQAGRVCMKTPQMLGTAKPVDPSRASGLERTGSARAPCRRSDLVFDRISLPVSRNQSQATP